MDLVELARKIIWWGVDFLSALPFSPLWVAIVMVVGFPAIILGEPSSRERITEHKLMLTTFGLGALAFIAAFVVIGGAEKYLGIPG